MVADRPFALWVLGMAGIGLYRALRWGYLQSVQHICRFAKVYLRSVQ